MMNQEKKLLFDKIYDETYHDILKFIICRCSNIQDVNDIIQEVYLEFYKILNKKDIIDNHLQSYLYKIAIYKIKKHYTLLQKLHLQSPPKIDECEFLEIKDNDINIEKLVYSHDTCTHIWKYIKKYKKPVVSKIFFLYYNEGLTIHEISQILNVNESYVKNCLYRTLKELKNQFGKENNFYE